MIVIIIMIKMWGIDIRKLFKIVSVKHILYLIVIGLLITLLYPIFNIPNLLNGFSVNKTGLMMPITNVFEQKGISFYYVIRTLLLIPFLEETLYRGIIQNKLKEKFSATWAIVISSLFFAVGHMAFEQSITVFFSSLLIGYIYHKSNNLSIVVLLHSFINLGFLFLKIEYTDTISVSILLYHFALIALLLFISKKYPKKDSHGN
ncbi:CPBP family intramembrane metalloprotease [Kordia sp. YSTF-M3]|uniref:CPBP family intramembrane metalloprotease n=1 Tax=Kordia aestuariivivens TaxID=2759037 RepID=A0ABR7Q5C7_9FLAO|nr:CPBP family intramembrane glutamic endopeptidase [Kordia aestuariivivens]MBC8753544.1 CPBP family intramembrane metalloprotease [Kordia aestuariivivens]